MIYLLDTSTCISFLRRRSSPVAAKLASVRPEEVHLCSVVKAELYYGAYRSQQSDRSLAVLREFVSQFRSLPFDDLAAEVYGQLRADMAGAGTLIGPNDLLIAAIALAHRAILVTENTDEFRRVKGLAVENWQTVSSG